MTDSKRPRSLDALGGLLRLLVALLVFSTGIASIGAGRAHAAEDPCLAGNWVHTGPVINSLNGEVMTGSVDLTFPSASKGAAILSVDIETELHYRHYVGTAEEPYVVTTASTPSKSAGVLDWTEPNSISIIPTEPASGAYGCTVGELSIAVPLAFDGSLAFTRSGSGPTSINLSVVNQGTGQGIIESFPGGIDCPSLCSGSFWSGQPVKLLARRVSSSFLGWNGPCSPLAPVTLSTGNVQAERECQLTGGSRTTLVTATFGHSLAVATTGSGTVVGAAAAPPLLDGFVLAPTIDCPRNCSAPFAQTVALKATPAHGYKFGGWTGSCRPLVETCQLSMEESSTVTAIFTTERTLPDLKPSFRRSFQGGHYAQTTMRPGTSLWRGENEVLPNRGSHSGEGYFGLVQPTTSAQAERLYNLAIWKNNAQCLQAYEVTEAWRAYIGRVAGGGGTQVLAPVVDGQAMTIPNLLHEGWIRRVGPCIALPLG
jgi:hypothetical protein